MKKGFEKKGVSFSKRKATYKDKKGKLKTTTVENLARRAYKAAHGKNYGE